MNVTTEIKMDLLKRGIIPVIDAVQGDALTRQIRIVLYSGGTEWTVPEGVSAMARFVRPDGSGGVYDTLPDGRKAVSISGNVVTVTLAPQVTTAGGSVFFAVTLVKGEAEISTFSVIIQVQHNPEAADEPGGDYVGVSGLLPGPATAAVGQYLRVLRVNAAGKVTALEAVDDPVGDINAVLDAINGEVV